MNFHLIRASPEHEDVVKNLMQLYIYDFSEYVGGDVDDNGLFPPYAGLEEYWATGSNRFAYVLKKNDKYIGFILVRFIETEERSYFSIAEFFIMKKYRREGIGKAAAWQIFNLHKGQWEVYQKENNKPAQVFWNKTISGYTKGQFNDRLENGRRIQTFEN
jgi:predicted acetyltransferase